LSHVEERYSELATSHGRSNQTDEDNQPFSLRAQQDRLDAYCKSQRK
jgi:hypothetical protein